jgi:hypothetical protein
MAVSKVSSAWSVSVDSKRPRNEAAQVLADFFPGFGRRDGFMGG